MQHKQTHTTHTTTHTSHTHTHKTHIGSKLDLLVENCGHINYGQAMKVDQKGVGSNVQYNGIQLQNFEMCSLPMDYKYVSKLPFRQFSGSIPTVPTFFRGILDLTNEPNAQDTYLSMSGWNKGIVLVNGFNLGRYWTKSSPQLFLYLPAPLLKGGQQNEIIIFESEITNTTTLQFSDHPIWNTPSK